LPASIQIKWLNTTPNETHANNITAIELTPSCGAFVASSVCPVASADPGVLTLSASGTGVGCGAVTTFTITVIDAPTGRVSFTPGFQLPVNGTCTISFTVNVNSNPTKDADPSLSGLQTAVLAGASATDAVNGNPGSGLGSAEVSFPAISTNAGCGRPIGRITRQSLGCGDPHRLVTRHQQQ
jgi:hypothetical protein